MEVFGCIVRPMLLRDTTADVSLEPRYRWCHFFVNHSFRCISACVVATLLKSIGVWNPLMAVRKKVETVHLRVSTTAKACLEGLANAMGKTSTRVIEDLIIAAAEKFEIQGIDNAVGDQYGGSGDWTLLKALQLAHVPDEPILKKLRTYFLAEEALSAKDYILVEAILWSPDVFSGDTEIFLESEGVITNPDDTRIYKVDLNAISRLKSSLEDYAEFRLKNKAISPSYVDYVRMIEANRER